MRIATVIGTEVLKLRRSKITWLSFAAYALFGLMAWFVLWIVLNPGAARDLGLVGAKAGFVAGSVNADWPGLLSFFAMLNVAGGMIIVSIAVIWLFGREYAEATAKNMLALPVDRGAFVVAKLLVGLVWSLLLTLFLILLAIPVGAVLGLGLPPWDLYAREAGAILLASLLVFALEPLVAWVTVASGGYLAPFGYTIATLLVANILAHTGWARWCPWSAVALIGGMTGPPEREVALSSGLVLLITFAAGLWAVLRHEYRADNSQ